MTLGSVMAGLYQLAEIHEKSLAEGLGMLMPGPERHVIDRGLLPFPQQADPWGYPQYFINNLAPVQRHGFTVWPVSAVVDDIRGRTCFYDVHGQLIGQTMSFNDYPTEWIAWLWYGNDSPDLFPINPLLLPSKLESRWTFVTPSNLWAYAAAVVNNTTYPPPAPSSGTVTTNTLFNVPGIRIAGFKVNEQLSDASFSFEMHADDLATFPHPAFHVLFTTNLATRSWKAVSREFVSSVPPGSTASFALSRSTVLDEENENPFPFFPLPAYHEPHCTRPVNYARSTINELNMYRREGCLCTPPPSVMPQAFFSLVSDVDSTGSGISDWWLNLHDIDPANALDIVPGSTGMTYLDFFLSGLSPFDLPPPPLYGTLDLTFSIDGDYAAWEMTVKGKGPQDRRVNKLSTYVPGNSASRTLSLYKGNAYEISMRWLTSNTDSSGYWYCWEALVDGKPDYTTYGDSTPRLRPNVETFIYGPGYVINNTDGLLSQHVHMNSDVGNVLAGKTAMLYVLTDNEEPVEIGFRRPDGTLTNQLPVSKWEGSLYLYRQYPEESVRVTSPRFIDTDPDRFQVYVKDRRRTESFITCTYEDFDASQAFPTISLFRQPDGTYLSESRIIITDEADRNNNDLVAAKAEHNIGRRMSMRALGDPIKISYHHASMGATETATIGIDVKTLHVDTAVMRNLNGSVPAVHYRIYEDIEAMRERFAQTSIKIDWKMTNDTTIYSFPPPTIVATNMTDWSITMPSTNQAFLSALTDEAKAIIDAANLDPNKVRIIYLPGPLKTHDDTSGNILGLAISSRSFQAADSNYFDTCFVTAPGFSHYVPAHEVGHLLRLDHSTQRWNLMYGTISPVPPNGNGKDLRTAKRLSDWQVDTMRDIERNPKLQ